MFRTGQEGTHLVLVSRDATKMVAVNIGSNTITALERAPGTTNWAAARWNETVIPVGRGPEGIDWSPDGKEIWTAHSRDGGVSIIDAATKKVVDLGQPARGATTARVSGSARNSGRWVCESAILPPLQDNAV